MNRLFHRRAMLSLSGGLLGSALLARSAPGKDLAEVRARYLKSLLPTRDDVAGWLAGRKYPFCKYDPELGYLHIDRDFKEGLNGAVCRYRYDQLMRLGWKIFLPTSLFFVFLVSGFLMLTRYGGAQ